MDEVVKNAPIVMPERFFLAAGPGQIYPVMTQMGVAGQRSALRVVIVVARTGTANPRRPKMPNGWRGIMRTKIRRLAPLVMLIGALLGPGLMAPAQAAGTTQVEGSGYYDDITGDECDAPPSEFSDYPALVLHGDLEGCLYAHVLSGKFTPSGVWIETGQELVVASLNGGPVGTFTTNYRFEGKYEADFTVEIHGRCQHPITAGSGTGAFAGVAGRLDFKDDVDNAMFYYRGHLTLG